MRAKLVVVLLSLCCALLAMASSAASAAQRIDMKVLLLGASGAEPSFLGWQAELRREGVPFDQLVATPGHAPITAATLSQTLAGGIEEARYEAVIVAVGQLPRCEEGGCVSALAPEEWAALASFEQTFNVRQLTAYTFPGPEVGLNWPTSSGPLDGDEATLTTAGQAVFPYLNGTVKVGAGTWGYGATPLEGAAFTTLLTDASGASLLGVYAHPEGREEMVQTFDNNAVQLHSELLRHGQLAWVTRGTFFGDQRNYLEMHVDDIFLPDDIWNPAGHFTDFNPADAVRISSNDVATAVAWSRATGLRLDGLYNGGGSVAYREEHASSDPLLAAFQANRATFGWVNHTYDHPNLDCSTRLFIEEEIDRNRSWATGAGLTTTGAELVTGEHSGLANLIPGNPGTIDPPSLESASVSATGGTLAANRWEYGITATDEGGETIASTTVLTTTGSTSEARLAWEAICHARTYKVYRRIAGGTWYLIETISQPEPAFRDEGPVTVRYVDRGAREERAVTPPSTNGAVLSPYGQNASFAEALRGTGVEFIATDASKPYPITPTRVEEATYPAGATWVDGTARAVPRYPTNVYYTVATREELLDEYNHLYLPPELGGVCVNTATTTCRSSAARWEEFVELESQLIFTHMMGNDPRPHYFHQTNLARSRTREGAVLYPVIDETLSRYERYFSTTSAPIQQLTHSQIGELLGRQSTWASVNGATVVGYIEREEVVVTNGERTVEPMPISGTEFGSAYAGTRSGWDELPEGTTRYRAATAWP